MSDIAWTTPQMKLNLEKLSEEAQSLANARIIKTEADRAVVALIQRLLETLLTGEPSTKPPARHHE